MTGALTGPRFGGTTDFTEADDPGHTWSPPNITSDPETGRLGNERGSVRRALPSGSSASRSPMPWQAFSRMAKASALDLPVSQERAAGEARRWAAGGQRREIVAVQNEIRRLQCPVIHKL